jgi:hypothetical protein
VREIFGVRGVEGEGYRTLYGELHISYCSTDVNIIVAMQIILYVGDPKEIESFSGGRAVCNTYFLR